LWTKKYRAKEGKAKFTCINSKKRNSTNAIPSKVSLEETSRQGGTSTAVHAAETTPAEV